MNRFKVTLVVLLVSGLFSSALEAYTILPRRGLSLPLSTITGWRDGRVALRWNHVLLLLDLLLPSWTSRQILIVKEGEFSELKTTIKAYDRLYSSLSLKNNGDKEIKVNFFFKNVGSSETHVDIQASVVDPVEHVDDSLLDDDFVIVNWMRKL